MNELFIDTSGWGCLFDASQSFHEAATTCYRTARSQNRKMVTTNYVLIELVALLTSPIRMPRPTIIDLIEGLKSSPYVEIVTIDEAIDRDAWQLLRRRPDKQWSWVDCASFVIMQQRVLQEALTTDHHF
ncbi:MAG: PIN domain-containing protein [Caldilineaceae bacterium]